MADISDSKQSPSQRLAEARAAIGRGCFEEAKTNLRRLVCENALRSEQYSIVSNLIDELVKQSSQTSALIRIAVLGSYTTQPIISAVRCALLAEGFLADVYEAPYGAYHQEIASAKSALYAFCPDVVLLAADISALSNFPRGPLSSEDVDDALTKEVDYWCSLWETLATLIGKPVLQHLFVVPEDEFMGVAERRAAWSPPRFIDALNARLIEAAPSFVRWIDVDRLAARVGRNNWRDPRLFHHGKLSFSPRFVPDYSLILAAAWRSAAGKTKKALVVDLDNTLWGGVIGDDGIAGICLGPINAEGEAFASFNDYIKALKSRGVILAVCSKNDSATAAEVFQSHPHMPLKLDDFAVFQCNWGDKASNLRFIARELNIDLSALVFVDDNPAECELVRQSLPEITVINLTGDPAQFPRLLDRQHLFDLSEFSREDIGRADSYAARRKAADLQAQATDLGSYLTSLRMVGRVVEADSASISRLAQMELKTNQFNLTSRRLAKEEIECFCADPESIVLTLTLADCFTDHGLVAYLIAVREGDVIRISNWLMSCRVFSRTAEHFLLNKLLTYAVDRNISVIVGEYIETPKNSVVANLYPTLGFLPIEGESGRWWRLSVNASAFLKTFITDQQHL